MTNVNAAIAAPSNNLGDLFDNNNKVLCSYLNYLP